MNGVTINRGQGGLGRQQLGQDYISGFISWLASGILTDLSWTSGAVKIFNGIQDAVKAGITNTQIGETASILETAVTKGDTGDTVNFYFAEPSGNNVFLGSYIQTAGDTTDTLFATHAAAAITANQYINGGYTATGSTGNILITLRPGLGVWANTNYATLLTFTYPVNVGSLAMGTPSQSTAGVASPVDILYYHINRYFIQSPNATLYVSLTETPSFSGYAFPEIGLIQTAANGAIRQCGVFVNGTFALAQITAMQAQVATLLTEDSPMSIIMGADITTTWETVSALTTLAGENSEHVSVSVGQDGANFVSGGGAALFAAYGKSITQVGDVLGLVSSSQVSDDIAWVATYTLSPDGIENAVPAFATGELLSTLTRGTINQVDTYRYIFGRTFINNTPNGTFINDSHCATAFTSDYAYIENNRTFDKASRLLYAAYIAQLAAPIVLQSNGTLTNASVAFFVSLGDGALASMISNNPNTNRPELSGFSVTVNPAQNVLQTSTLTVSVSIQPVGVARNIVINLQFVVSL